MLIETYECETSPIEQSDEALALIEKLGAAKQDNFYRAGQVIAPYRFMTLEEFAVYSVLLPNKQDIGDYDAGPIPLRALQVGSHAKDILETGTLVVWHQGVGKDDPVLTLRVGSSWSGKYYLLARWGDVLEEWHVLVERAVSLHRNKVRAQIATLRASLDQWDVSAESMIRAGLQAGKIDVPNCYWHNT